MIHTVSLPHGAMRLVREDGSTVLLSAAELQALRVSSDQSYGAADHLAQHAKLSECVLRKAGVI